MRRCSGLFGHMVPLGCVPLAVGKGLSRFLRLACNQAPSSTGVHRVHIQSTSKYHPDHVSHARPLPRTVVRTDRPTRPGARRAFGVRPANRSSPFFGEGIGLRGEFGPADGGFLDMNYIELPDVPDFPGIFSWRCPVRDKTT